MYSLFEARLNTTKPPSEDKGFDKAGRQMTPSGLGGAIKYAGTEPPLPHLLGRDAEFLGDDLHYKRGTETALAAPHAGTNAAFDGVNGIDGERGAESVQDLAFAHFLTAADDLAVIGILGGVRAGRAF